MRRPSSRHEELYLEAKRRGLVGRKPHFSSLEDILTSERGFRLKTATPLQLAVCRLIDGRPLGELKHHEHVRKAIGDVTAVEGRRPKKVVLCAGIRTFKSMVAAGAGLLAPGAVDCSPMLANEGARFAVVSTNKDNARKVMSHALTLVHGEGRAASMLAEDPTADTLKMNRDGREFTFKVVAGSRAGSTLVSDWSCGVVFDEAARMLSSDQGVINIDEGIAAVEGRLLPGAQMFLLSSPHAPFGTFHDLVVAHHGKATPEIAIVWAEGPWLNPFWWTEERCNELRIANPDAYQTDVLAKFRSPEESIFAGALLDAAVRAGEWDLPVAPGCAYSAAIDPGTRRNAWTLVVATRQGRVRVALARQWVAKVGEPLRPRAVFREIAELLAPYGITELWTDQWSFEAMRDIGLEFGLDLVENRWSTEERVDAYGKVKTLLEEEQLELHPDPVLRGDLVRVKRRVTQSGVTIVLPITADGRHCDYAPALVLAVAPYLPDVEAAPEEGTPEYWKAKERADIEREKQRLIEEQNSSWWE